MGRNQARKENKMVRTIKEDRQEVLGHLFARKSAGYKSLDVEDGRSRCDHYYLYKPHIGPRY